MDTTWINKREFDKGIKDCGEAIRIDSNFAIAYGNRGNAWFGKRDYGKALLDFHDASRLDPKLASAFYGKACCYALERQTERAIDNLRPSSLELGYRDFDSDFTETTPWILSGRSSLRATR